LQLKRIDIRNHRKIVVIDHRIGYTGSMNMVDPQFFNVGRGVGTWIDVMARVEGPAAEVLELTMALDWAAEHRGRNHQNTLELVDSIRVASSKPAPGSIAAQIVPSGPDQSAQLIHEMLITLMYNTRKRLVLTTPYFIPSEAMMQAIISAAHRGVRVTLVVPQDIDSKLVRHASKSYFEDLLRAGVEVFTYRGGLLHSKIVTADDDVGMLGSVNMDKRSFSINFEISMFVYDQGFVSELRSLQQSYIEHAERIEFDEWCRRPVYMRLLQNTLQLMAPIL
jgi:cardiolipin synthase